MKTKVKRTAKPEIHITKGGYRRGLLDAARFLGVSYTHLFRVIEHKRESKTLLAKVELHFPELIKPNPKGINNGY